MNPNISAFKKYCISLTEYKRYRTREVDVGGVPLGGDNPIRIQSMTTTDTMDTKATVEQTIRMVESGCDYVRITAPSKLEAQNLEAIKKELRTRGYNVPLIADIHFTPNAAEIAARIVEKVRVNPGNYADRKKFETFEYTDNLYEAELERIREKFTPLVKICKEYGTAMRIGTNHGSLSDRIMNRYGDTPLGMVESALEFVRICQDLNYYQIILSMKSSNPKVMVQAYRLLISKMDEEGMNYPLHLGVTEAGGGEDGRIKSAIGIGTLMEDGIGDTIRVSLTEDPEYEAPVAVLISERYKSRVPHDPIEQAAELFYDPLEYKKRPSFEVFGIGGNNVPRVLADYSGRIIKTPDDLNDIGYFYDEVTDKWNMNDTAADLLYLGNREIPFDPPNGIRIIYDYSFWKTGRKNGYPLFTSEEYLSATQTDDSLNFISVKIHSLTPEFLVKIRNDLKVVLVIETSNAHGMAEQRRGFIKFLENRSINPVIIKRDYKNITLDQLRLFSSTDLGALLIDGFGEGVWINAEIIENESAGNNGLQGRSFINQDEPKEKIINRILFGILQAARTRISKTEYIACPSCGRTLFDLQETTEMIRGMTGHLKGLKIAIMGCIVNGPGEMADADYGYVGSGIGKITLYRGKEIVKRNIPAAGAVESLIELIKEDGSWQEIRNL